jgi:hypothetical protein
MFIQTWNKYLPIIKILFKRSANGAQTLDMNSTDFQRAAGGRKVKYTFSIVLVKGRIQNIDTPPPLAKDLVAALQQDDVTRTFIRQYELELSMNSSFQLLIKNTTPPAAEPEPDGEEEVNSDKEVKTDDASAVVK